MRLKSAGEPSQKAANRFPTGGEGGIRTHVEANAPKQVFETVAVDHLATSPSGALRPNRTVILQVRNLVLYPLSYQNPNFYLFCLQGEFFRNPGSCLVNHRVLGLFLPKHTFNISSTAVLSAIMCNLLGKLLGVSTIKAHLGTKTWYSLPICKSCVPTLIPLVVKVYSIFSGGTSETRHNKQRSSKPKRQLASTLLIKQEQYLSKLQWQ